MTEQERAVKKRKRLKALFLILSCGILLSIGSIYLVAASYLRTPAAARRVAQLLTDYLQYPVTITSLGLRGGTVSISGVRILNPGGFKGEFLSCRSVAVTPEWFALLRGRNIFREIALRELNVTLSRNNQGELNAHQLLRALSRHKKGGETLIQRLIVSQAAVTFESFQLHNLGINLRDFSTTGTTGARFLLTCKDVGGDILRLEGTGRLGTAPWLDLAFSAPSVSLQAVAQSFPARAWPDFGNSSGSISLMVHVRERNVAAQGTLRVDRLPLTVQNHVFPVKGELDFRGRYDISGDQAFLDSCSLNLNNIVTLQGTGTMRQVKSKRTFDAAFFFQPIDLGAASAMLPQELRHGAVAGGTLRASGFRLSGDAMHGITAGGGSVAIREGHVTTGDRSFVKGLTAEAAITRVNEGWQARGQLSQKEGAEAVVEALHAPFTVLFSRGLRLLMAETSAFSANVSGIPLQGRIGYDPGKPVPLSLRVAVSNAPLSPLNRWFSGKHLTVSSGTANGILEATGKGPAGFTGKFTLSCYGLRGNTAGKQFAAGETVTEGALRGVDGMVSASGHLRSQTILVDGKRAEGDLEYSLTRKDFTFSAGTLKADGAVVTFEKVHGQMPLPVQFGRVTKTPLHLELAGIGLRSGAVRFDGATGTAAVELNAGDGKRWLDGRAAVSIPTLSYGATGIGSGEVAFRFAENGGVADLRGRVLAGDIQGTAHFDPFDRSKKETFSMDLHGARCSGLGSFAPPAIPLRAKDGLMNVKMAGEYTGGQGLQCRMEAEATGIALTGIGGKTLLEGGAVRGVFELGGDSLFIRALSATAGNNMVTVTGGGKLDHPFSLGREGKIVFSLAKTPLDALFTAVINSLPRSLQEASASGTIGADGTIRVSQKQVLLDGSLTLDRAGIDIASQNVSVSDMTGSIPVSLNFSGQVPASRPGKRRFSRDNFLSLLADLRKTTPGGRTCKIGRIRFGNMEFGETTLAFKAVNGLTEVTTLQSSLLEGSLLGEGFFRYGKNFEYGADLTVSDLSLRALCNAYPAIKGYISGRVDGIVSLYQEGTGIDGLHGFFDIWTRSAKGEKMLVSKEFLQKLAGRKFKGIFFRSDRPYDRGEIRGYLAKGYLTFDTLDISHTNLFGVRDLSVTVAPVQNRIAFEHLLSSIREAATRGKTVGGEEGSSPPPAGTEFKWQDE